MKQFISVDSRAAGQGKTTGFQNGIYTGTGIYAKMHRLYRAGERQLIVVASKDLQTQYINANPTLPIMMIQSSDDDSDLVSKRLISALAHRNPIILITHSAFTKTVIEWSIKLDYHLILDEAINPYGYQEVSLKLTDNEVIKLNLPNIMEVDQRQIKAWESISKAERGETITIEDYTDIGDIGRHWACAKIKATDRSILNEGDTWTKITNPNYRVWVHKDNWPKIKDNCIDKLYVGLDLDPAVFTGWKSVGVSAAAFEYTLLCNWFIVNEFTVSTIPGCEFIPTEAPEFHGPNNREFRWSKYQQQESSKIYEDFIKYIESVIGENKCLFIANNQNLYAKALAKTSGKFVRLPHNAHGMNSYTDFKEVSIGSAVNPAPMQEQFLREQFNHYGESTDEIKHTIMRAFAAYDFYQILMRSALRIHGNQEKVRVFLLDQTILMCLGDFFNMNTINTVEYEIKLPEKKVPMTAAERMAKSRAKKNSNKTKKVPMTAAERMRKMREKKKMEQGN